MHLGTLSAAPAVQVNADPLPCNPVPGPTAPGGLPPCSTTQLPPGFATTCPSGSVWDDVMLQCVNPSAGYCPTGQSYDPASNSCQNNSWIPGVSNNMVLIGGSILASLFLFGRRR